MYLLMVVMGLVVYGSDFDSITGWLYVAPLILIAIVHKWVWSRRFKLSSDDTAKFICASAAVAGVIGYAPLHMNYWDEHSVSQAVWLAILGVCSYLISVMAAAKISEQKTFCRGCASGALALIGVIWLLAIEYPMIVWFFLGLIFIVSLLWFSPLPSKQQQESAKDTSQTDVIAKYTILLLAIDISSVIWDYQVNTAWAFYVGAVFIAAALGFYLRFADHSDKFEQTAYIAAIVNFTLACVWPAYLLWGVHVVVAGLCMGYLLPHAISRSGGEGGLRLSFGWMVWFFMGLVLSNAWYANLQWAFTRLIVVLPFVLLGFLYLKVRLAALKHHV
jgi:hypothetical protein